MITLGGIADNALEESLINAIFGYALNFGGGHASFLIIYALLPFNFSLLVDENDAIFTI
jgi:hypothetical protein